jgi:hypothetical protein
MVGSNKTYGKTRNNRRHQRGGLLSWGNFADQAIYPYMHDDPVSPYKALPQYNTSEFKLFVANNIDPIRMFTSFDGSQPNYGIFTLKGQKFIDFGNHLRAMRDVMWKKQSALVGNQHLPDNLHLGWVMTPDNQYVNIFTNQKQAGKPTQEADGKDAWSLSVIEKQAIVRPTLTADKTKITTTEKVTITPTYGDSATLMVTICQPTMIVNSDVNDSAENKPNGLIKTTHGSAPFSYENLPAGKYVLRLIGNSTESEPLTITVEEPKPSGRGGKTRRHKRRACKRTRRH